jgi:hypothetical protein
MHLSCIHGNTENIAFRFFAALRKYCKSKSKSKSKSKAIPVTGREGP